MRVVLGALAYILPTFFLGYVWHLIAFKSQYDALHIYRGDVIVPLGLAAIVIQGLVWATVYQRLFAGENMARGASKFFVIAAPLAWSFMVLATAAKHPMASVPQFVLIETAFVAIHYLVVSPLMALAFARRQVPQHAI